MAVVVETSDMPLLYSVSHEPCPCGRRPSPSSPQALGSKGLRGFWVQPRETCQSRYLHPVELKALLSILPHHNYNPSELRCTNCLLGLAAIPLQSTWVYAHLFKAVAKLDATCSFIDPGQAVAARLLTRCLGAPSLTPSTLTRIRLPPSRSP